MSTEKISDYTNLELYLVNGGLNLHLNVADGDGPEKVARLLLALEVPEILREIGKLMAAKLLEVKGKNYTAKFLLEVSDIINQKSVPVIKPSEVFGKIR